jgi:hypothetical protein
MTMTSVMTGCPEKYTDCELAAPNEQAEVRKGLPPSFVERVCEFLERYASDPAQLTKGDFLEGRKR